MDVRGKRVLLKPNMVEYAAERVINTHPALVAGAAQAMLRAGAASVVVAEGPGHRRDIEYLVTVTGLYDYLRDVGVRFVDLNHDDVRSVTLGSRFTDLTELQLPVELLRADLVVSMPKLKTHHWAGMTGSMKNLFGVVPGAVYGWPKNILHWRGIDNSIVDLVSTDPARPGHRRRHRRHGRRWAHHGHRAARRLCRDGAGPGRGGCDVRARDGTAAREDHVPPDGGGVPGQRRGGQYRAARRAAGAISDAVSGPASFDDLRA